MQHSCSHSNAICKHRFQNTLEPRWTTHTQAHPTQLEATVTMRQKKSKPTAAAPAAHTRYLSSSPAATLHGKTHRLPPHNIAHATFMQPFQCDLQAQIPKHPITTHTQAHPTQLEASVTMRQKKRQTDRSRTRRTHEVPFIVACSHFTRKNTRFRAPAKHSPCNIHAAIPMRSASTDSKTHSNHAHTSTPNAAWSHRYNAAKKKSKPTAAAPAAHTRYLSSSPAATLHGKTQGFVLRLPPHNIAHATFMQPFQCDLQAQIPKHPITTHTQAHPTQLEATVTMRQKKKRQTDRSRTRRTHEVPFIVACSHFTRKNTRFRAPASSPKHSPCNIHAAIPMRSASTDSKTP